MKIFGIGLSNTGTRSLAEALSILGYKTIHYPWSMKDIDEYDASMDIPVACRYKELDKLYPNSKFILTIRPFKEWIEKRRNKPPDLNTPSPWKLETRILMYGDIKFNEERLTQIYINHHNEVQEYFKCKENLLVLQLEEKNKWELLCNFLDKPIPNIKYPWNGKSKRVYKKLI